MLAKHINMVSHETPLKKSKKGCAIFKAHYIYSDAQLSEEHSSPIYIETLANREARQTAVSL